MYTSVTFMHNTNHCSAMPPWSGTLNVKIYKQAFLFYFLLLFFACLLNAKDHPFANKTKKITIKIKKSLNIAQT